MQTALKMEIFKDLKYFKRKYFEKKAEIFQTKAQAATIYLSPFLIKKNA